MNLSYGRGEINCFSTGCSSQFLSPQCVICIVIHACETKYIIPEEGKDYVLGSIGALWRSHKSRTKKKVTGKVEKKMLETNQALFLIIKENSESQKDRHTTGLVSFARKRHALEKAENAPPSEARMYYETRKRTVGRTYKTTYEVIEDNINQMKGCQSKKQRKLLGRCTKRVKEPSNSNVLIPNEFLELYRAQIVKDTAAEIMQTSKQQLPSEMFSRIVPAFEDQSGHLINDIQQCPDGGENKVNHHDGLEGTKIIDNEELNYEE